MENSNSSQPSKWKQLQLLLNTVNHILIGFVVVYMTFLAKSLSFSDTSLHALVSTIGFHLLAAEAMMCHYPENRLTRNFSHRTKTRLHSALQIVGGSMGLLAAIGKFTKTEVHFTTIHGKFGLATSFMCFASMMGGVVNTYPFLLKKLFKPVQIKLRHNLFGLITFTLAMSTIFLGYNTIFFYKFVDSYFIPFISSVTLVVWLLTIIGPTRSLLGKLKYRR
ncbi:uncharacterized protein LOC129938354 [Eupeodes corollae]|uniref:uncharacterized protein LOC129938354 n=1 Tax=Eupeodes corollae TaxID=290404 RepID=UPI00249158AE|nr:uncharacterized protein LOC129938354 [Eupeodes corollae]